MGKQPFQMGAQWDSALSRRTLSDKRRTAILRAGWQDHSGEREWQVQNCQGVDELELAGQREHFFFFLSTSLVFDVAFNDQKEHSCRSLVNEGECTIRDL